MINFAVGIWHKYLRIVRTAICSIISEIFVIPHRWLIFISHPEESRRRNKSAKSLILRLSRSRVLVTRSGTSYHYSTFSAVTAVSLGYVMLLNIITLVSQDLGAFVHPSTFQTAVALYAPMQPPALNSSALQKRRALSIWEDAKHANTRRNARFKHHGHSWRFNHHEYR